MEETEAEDKDGGKKPKTPRKKVKHTIFSDDDNDNDLDLLIKPTPTKVPVTPKTKAKPAKFPKKTVNAVKLSKSVDTTYTSDAESSDGQKRKAGAEILNASPAKKASKFISLRFTDLTLLLFAAIVIASGELRVMVPSAFFCREIEHICKANGQELSSESPFSLKIPQTAVNPYQAKLNSKKSNLTATTKESSGSKAKSNSIPPLPPPTPPPSERKQTAELSWTDLPKDCPAALCTHPLPPVPVPRILALFRRKKELTDTGGPQARGIGLLDLEICQAITTEHRHFYMLQIGKQRNWPLSETKYEYPQAIKHKACRYYAPLGAFIIYSCLMRFIAENEQKQQLEQRLFDTLMAIVDEDQNFPDDAWNNYDDSTHMSMKDFVNFILVPFVAICLIAQDSSSGDMQTAIFERNNSKEYGELVHPEDDANEQVHDLHRDNMKAIQNIGTDTTSYAHPPPPKPPKKSTHLAPLPPPAGALQDPSTAPPRHRKNYLLKASSLIRLPPSKPVQEEEITMDDYEIPKPRPKAKPKMKAERPKSKEVPQPKKEKKEVVNAEPSRRSARKNPVNVLNMYTKTVFGAWEVS
ncbi:hypothetical protein B0H10DRAFT_1967169 [Mycena sp. CBHHK59/15]|nr:hypothetical protein B0H10DRAFT_1967169 [Mycena sp. CBHHK59/15]